MKTTAIKKTTYILTLLLISNCIHAKEFSFEDIINFIEKRDQCDYFRGEISGESDIDNARDINIQLDKYCKGTDETLAELKNKYKNNKEITDKLNSYESKIESHTTDINSDLFDKYLVDIYRGKTIPPKEYTQEDGIWFDDLGKAVNPPIINFAGSYNIGLHSCGYGCRYYTLTNLTNGKDFSKVLQDFTSNPENNTVTNYFIELFSKPDSNLLQARYYETPDSEDYQDCYFIFKDKNLEKIGNEIKCPIFK